MNKEVLPFVFDGNDSWICGVSIPFLLWWMCFFYYFCELKRTCPVLLYRFGCFFMMAVREQRRNPNWSVWKKIEAS